MSHSRAESAVEKLAESAVEALGKPLLRGYSHAAVAPLAAVATIYLVWSTSGDLARQLTLLIYGCSLVLLFAVSATYHVGNWPVRVREVLRRFDHSNIFLLIAGTYTPIVFTMLSGWWRVGILVAVWVPAAAGVAISVSGLPMRRGVLTMLYILVGWIAAIAIPQILQQVGLAGGLLLLGGGVFYSLGALCYALKWPPLWRKVFSYHEVFHLFVIAASGFFLVFILQYVVRLG
ncbi:MAG: hemolysin [Chloroflexota bacterium]|jgi:hemolysin III|nr:hemolysin [Chloroflexota bacterium]